jgi:signal peptidase
MKIIRKVIHIVLEIVVIIILPLAVFMMVTSKTDFILGIRSYVVESGSMTPTLPVGSVIFDQKVSQYHTGDIITFTRDGQTVTHRIDKVMNGKFQVKGDANKVADEDLVAPSDIQGKELVMVPYLGFAAAFLKTFYGLLFFIILPCVLLVLFEIWNLKGHIEKETEKKMRAKLAQEKVEG